MGTEKLEYTANTLAAASAVTRGAAMYCQPNCGLSVHTCSVFHVSVNAPCRVSRRRVLSVMCTILPVSLSWYRAAPAAVAASMAALVATIAFCHLAGSATVENKFL